MKKEKIKKAGEGIKKRIIKRQNIIYFTLIGIGTSFAVTTISGTKDMTGEAIAFIITGSIGIIMSWTTTDIGESIKAVMREVGRNNQKILKSIAKSQDTLVSWTTTDIGGSIRQEMREISRENQTILESLTKSQDRLAKSLDELKEISKDEFSKTQQEISKVHDDTTKLLQK